MAAVSIYLGEAKLSSKNVKILEDKFNKKVVKLPYINSDVDLDGNFVETVPWSGQLWDKIADELGISGVKAKKITANLKSPGDYAVEVETWDQMYKGKISIAHKTPDSTTPRIKKNTNPAKVVVQVKGAAKRDLPSDFHGDLDHLVKEMKKPSSYSYVGGTGSHKGWAVKFNGHQSHEQPGHGWKAYIDEPSMGTGTTWRLYFTYEFDAPSKTLNVDLTAISQDH